MAKKRRPTIVVDEHVHPEVAGVYREVGFRTLSAARDRRYAGRDEHDYVDELYAANEIFVTSDLKFMGWVLKEHGTRHAGLVCLPFADTAFRVGFAAVTAGWFGIDRPQPVRDARQDPLLGRPGLHELDSESRIRIVVSANEVLEEP